MRLSEAIRLGSMLGPQSYSGLHTRRKKFIFFGPEVNEYCALGAAFQAIGATKKTVTLSADSTANANFRGKAETLKAGQEVSYIDNPWVCFFWQQATCPVCGHTDSMHRVIPHMNDVHQLARQAIADWVEHIERAQGIHDPSCDSSDVGTKQETASPSVAHSAP